MPSRLFPLVLLAASLAPGQPAPDSAPILDSRTAQMLPPNSALVLGIHWRKLVESGLFDQVKSQLVTQAAAFPGLAKLEDVLRNQVDAIVLAGSADALPQMNKAAGGPGKRNPPMLVVIKGRFNLAALRAWAGEKKGATEVYQDVELLRMSGANPPTLRWSMIDGGTLLLGERRDLIAAIDRRRAPPSAAQSPLLARSAELAVRSDFWMHMRMPPPSPAGPPAPADQLLKDLKSVDVGMSFSDGLRMDANLLAADHEAAQKLALALQAMLALAAQGEGQNAEAEQMLRRLRIQPQGSYVSLAFAMSKSELDRLTAERLRAGGSAPASGPVAARPPDPPGPKTIRITGLEGGPVEIPVGGGK